MVAKVLFVTNFEACLNVIDTALQKIMYWVRFCMCQYFTFCNRFCTSVNLVEIIHFSHCKTHCMLNYMPRCVAHCALSTSYSGVLEPQKIIFQKVQCIYVWLSKNYYYYTLPSKWSSRNLSEKVKKLALRLHTTAPPLTAFCHWLANVLMLMVPERWSQH
jgi:hypothetical protein